MNYMILFNKDELYGLTRHLIKSPPAIDWFGNINVLGVVLTVIMFPMFVLLDTVVLPFLLLHGITIKKKDKCDLILEKYTKK